MIYLPKKSLQRAFMLRTARVWNNLVIKRKKKKRNCKITAWLVRTVLKHVIENACMHASVMHLKEKNQSKWAIAFTCSKRSCRVWKDLDRSRVCRNVHTVNMALHTASDSASAAMSDQTKRSVRIRFLWKIRCIVAHTGRLPFWSFHINHSVHIPREHLWVSLVGPMRKSFFNFSAARSTRTLLQTLQDWPQQISRRWQCFGIRRTVCVYCMNCSWPKWHSNIPFILVQRVDSSTAILWDLDFIRIFQRPDSLAWLPRVLFDK